MSTIMPDRPIELMPREIDFENLMDFWEQWPDDTWVLSADAKGAYENLMAGFNDYQGPQSLLGKAAILETVRHLPDILMAADDERMLRTHFWTNFREIYGALDAADQQLKIKGETVAILGPNDAGEPTFGLYVNTDHAEGLWVRLFGYNEDFTEGEIKAFLGSQETAGINLLSGAFYPTLADAHAVVPISAIVRANEIYEGGESAIAIGEQAADDLAHSLGQRRLINHTDYMRLKEALAPHAYNATVSNGNDRL